MTESSSPSSSRARRVLVVSDDPDTAGRLAAELAIAPGLIIHLRDSLDESCPLDPWPDLVVVDLGEPEYATDTAWRFRRVLDAVHRNPPPVLAVARPHDETAPRRACRLDAFATVPAHDPARLRGLVRLTLAAPVFDAAETLAA